ncbi:hypothetical protein FACS1894111_02300 [Clostridia bacterium]|nr:hypothetical protein FACS1894111_02300 [Clostridia bacterium]
MKATKEKQRHTVKCPEVKVFFLVLLVWGLLFSFLVPMGQIPDEQAHLSMIGESLGNPDMAGILSNDVALGQQRIAWHDQEKIDPKEWQAALTKQPGYTLLEVLPKGISLSVLKHFPATIGILLGLLLHLPTFWVMQLGELMNLLFYAGVSALAFWLMPIRRNVFVFLMLFPTAMQQASSISYDAIVLPLCYLFIAYLFHLKYRAKKIGLKELFLLFAVLLLVTYSKVPYALLAGLFLILPLDKINISLGKLVINQAVIKKWRIPLLVLFLILVVAAAYVFRENRYLQVVFGMLTEPVQAVRLYYHTLWVSKKYWAISMVGSFGWMDSGVSLWFAVFVWLFAIVISMVCYEKITGNRFRFFALFEKKAGKSVQESERIEHTELFQMSPYERTIIWLTAVFLFLFMILSIVDYFILLTVYDNPFENIHYNIHEDLYKIPFIDGVQGRYFLPFLSLFFLPLPHLKQIGKKKMWAALGLVVLITAIYTISILVHRYWG